MIEYYINLVSSFLVFGAYTMINDYNNYYKIKKRSNIELDKVYNKIVLNVLFNVFIASIPAIYVFNNLLNNSNYHLLQNLPLAGKYLCMPLLVDVLFYSVHRILHTKYLFYFHKRHHELIHPVGIGSFYMSLVEFYGALVFPIFGPLVLLGSNSYHTHLWITFTVFNGICIAHSNTKNLSEFHDYHHNKIKGYNYGIDIFMDRLLRTKKN